MLYDHWYFSNINMDSWCKIDNIERRNNIALEDFIQQYLIPNKPVIVTDIVTKFF